MDRPLRLLGAAPETVLLTMRPPVAVANAHTCFANMELHAGLATTEVSLVCYGPSCSSLRFHACRLTGCSGLLLPLAKGAGARLILQDCQLSGARQGLAAIAIEAGYLQMDRCTVYSNSVGIDVGPSATATIAHSNIRFNNMAFLIDGRLHMHHSAVWGNTKLGNTATQLMLGMAPPAGEDLSVGE